MKLVMLLPNLHATGGRYLFSSAVLKLHQTCLTLTAHGSLLTVDFLNSQGAQLTHKAVSGLPADVASHIKAVVVFGDPNKGQPFKGIQSSIVRTECYADDNVCNGLPLPIGKHNEYDKRIGVVTEWIVQTLGPV